MEGSTHIIKVGLTVVLAIVLMIAGYLALNEIQFRGSTYMINGQFADGLGIKEGQPVLLRGKKIGEVIGFDILDGDARYATAKIAIREGIDLYSDYSLIISQDGLLGEKYISVNVPDPRDPYAKVVTHGDSLAGGNQTDVNKLLANADQVLSQVAEILDPDKVEEGLGGLVAQVQETLASVDLLLLSVNDLVSGNEGYINGSMQNLHAMSANFLAMSESLAATAGEVNSLAADPAQRDRLQTIMANLEDISRNMNELTTELNSLAGDDQVQQDFKDSVRLTKETLEETKATMVRFQGTLDAADTTLKSAGTLMGTAEGAVADAQGKLEEISKVGDAIEINLGFNVRAVDRDDNQHLNNEDSYVGDLNVAVGYEDTYVYLGADEIGEDTNLNLMMGYGDLAGLSFRGGVYRGELGLGVAYNGPVGAEVMVYDTDDPKFNAYGYVPLMDKINLIVGGEDLGNDPVATVGVGIDLR